VVAIVGMPSEPHARGQDDAETVEKGGLSRIGLCDASQTDLPVR
jgi:hypothetical protein